MFLPFNALNNLRRFGTAGSHELNIHGHSSEATSSGRENFWNLEF